MSRFSAAAVMPRDARIRAIGADRRPPVRTLAVLLQGRYRDLPVVRVPQEALVYRVDNGRLAAALEEQAARERTALGALRARAETPEVQGLLHDLLLARARDPQGPIFAELERAATQTEPLLIGFDGVVINGNRRLSAMRALLARDSARYAGFAEVLAAVLPPETTPADVEYVEAALQMAPETKLGYGWIDRRLTLRKQRDALGLPIRDILAAYRIDDPAQVDRELAQLALAERYLDGYCGEPGRYSRVAEDEVLFAGLQAQLARLDPALRPLWEAAGFAMIHGRPAEEKPERHARHFPFSPPVPADLPAAAPRRLAGRFGIPDAGAAAEHGLLAAFRDRSASAATTRLIADTLDEMRLEAMERLVPERLLRKVRQAGRLIARIEPGRLTPEQRRTLRGDLAALQAQAAHVLGEIDGRPAEPAPRARARPLLRKPYGAIPGRLFRRIGLSRRPSP
ncbi:MAG TPA: hypothetical protein VHL98_06435 [Microvirga sp.]|jgi:hypothetical protein|nr:hypothetical protein [Microvirga sp.]